MHYTLNGRKDCDRQQLCSFLITSLYLEHDFLDSDVSSMVIFPAGLSEVCHIATMQAVQLD